MDQNNSTDQNNQMAQPPLGISGLFSKKKMVFIAVPVGVILLAGVFLLIGEQKTVSKTENSVKAGPTTSPTAVQSVELRRAIEEAKNSAKEYDQWQDNTRKNYPWIRRFPLADTDFYIYFDLDRRVFIADIYPKSGENPEQIKAKVINRLTSSTTPVDVDKYPIIWTVKPK